MGASVIADVVFDIPLARSFSYAVPEGMSVGVGQRVSAPLQGRARVGMVVALHEGEPAGLRAVERAVEAAPILSRAALDVGRWAAEESLSSLGSTLLSLVPPVPPGRASEPIAPAPSAHAGLPVLRARPSYGRVCSGTRTSSAPCGGRGRRS